MEVATGSILSLSLARGNNDNNIISAIGMRRQRTGKNNKREIVIPTFRTNEDGAKTR
jgi:hypothetical protein